MLLYTTVGAHDLKASYKSYDAILKPLGYVRLKEFATEIGYGPKGPNLGHETVQPPAGHLRQRHDDLLRCAEPKGSR